MKKSGLEALEGAIRFETEARNYFLAAAGKAKNETARKLFEYIAEEEIRHIKVINQLHHRMKQTGAWEDCADDHAEMKTDSHPFLKLVKEASSKITADSDDLQALEHAVELEENGLAYYRRKEAETEVAFEKKFFDALALEEEDHRLLFSDAREYILDPEGWLARKERSAYDGG